MKVLRGGRTSDEWLATDSVPPSALRRRWIPGKAITVDATKDKTGRRHTDVGIVLDVNDLVAMLRALKRTYPDLDESFDSQVDDLAAVVAEAKGSRVRRVRPHRRDRQKVITTKPPEPAFMKAMRPSVALAAVIGDSAMPRTEITKRLWSYIRRNKLQDRKDRRMIHADDKLRLVFGGKKAVSMFEMTRLVSKHLS